MLAASKLQYINILLHLSHTVKLNKQSYTSDSSVLSNECRPTCYQTRTHCTSSAASASRHASKSSANATECYRQTYNDYCCAFYQACIKRIDVHGHMAYPGYGQHTSGIYGICSHSRRHTAICHRCDCELRCNQATAAVAIDMFKQTTNNT